MKKEQQEEQKEKGSDKWKISIQVVDKPNIIKITLNINSKNNPIRGRGFHTRF